MFVLYSRVICTLLDKSLINTDFGYIIYFHNFYRRTEWELSHLRWDVFQDKFIWRRILINTFLFFIRTWSAHFELRTVSRICILKPCLFFWNFFNFKVELLGKGFIVDAISQERSKKLKIRDILLGFSIFSTLSPISRKLTKYQPRINSSKITPQAEILYHQKRLLIFRGVGGCLHKCVSTSRLWRLLPNNIGSSYLTLVCLSALMRARKQRDNL